MTTNLLVPGAPAPTPLFYLAIVDVRIKGFSHMSPEYNISVHGRAIKVSDDGPISIFIGGVLRLEIG